MEWFVHPYFAAIVVPLLFILAGAFSRKLVRRSPWTQEDFYLGVQCTLSAFASALIYLFELARALQQGGAAATKASWSAVTGTGFFILVSFFLLLWILSTHQDWEKHSDRKRERNRLAILCPALGAILLASFIVLVKGG